MGFFFGLKVFFRGGSITDSVRTLRREQMLEGCHEPRSTTFQTVVALPVDVVIPDRTAFEQLDMPPRQFAPAFARLPGGIASAPSSKGRKELLRGPNASTRLRAHRRTKLSRKGRSARRRVWGRCKRRPAGVIILF